MPDLHKPGGDNVPRSHHEFANENNDVDDNMEHGYYKDKSNSKHVPTLATPKLLNFTTIKAITLFSTLIVLSNNNTSTSTIKPTLLSNHQDPNRPSPVSVESTQHNFSSFEDGFATYSTALVITIAIGCSLLLLNLLIFAGTYITVFFSNQI